MGKADLSGGSSVTPAIQEAEAGGSQIPGPTEGVQSQTTVAKLKLKTWMCSSMVERLPTMHQTLSWSPSRMKRKKSEGRNEGVVSVYCKATIFVSI